VIDLMRTTNRTLRLSLLATVVVSGVLVLHAIFGPDKVLAQPARFDHVMIVSTGFLYKGVQGMLVMDRRNANVWFFPRQNETFQDPVFVMRLQFEKLDNPPR
jgi:hypothetical protein